MEEASIHDNYVISYTVLCEDRKLIMHTEQSYLMPAERTDVIFHGMEAYFLEGDNFGTVLFSIDEVQIDSLVEENRSKFDEGTKYAWPGPWNKSVEDSKKYLKDGNCRAWSISSSIGMRGFVIAQGIKFRKHTTKPKG